MAERQPQRVVRRLHVERAAPLDEQIWPVNVALLLLAGFVEGIVIARLDFFDPRPLFNAGVWSGTIVLTLGIGTWLVRRLDNRRVRRSLQLATVLSLLFHAVLAVVMNNDVDVAIGDDVRRHAVEETYEPVELQTYDMPTIAADAPRQDFERPVEAPVETVAPNLPQPEPVRIRPEPELNVAVDPAPPAPQPAPKVEGRIPDAVRPDTVRPDAVAPNRSATPRAVRPASPAIADPKTQATAPKASPAEKPAASELDAPLAPQRDTATTTPAPSRVADSATAPRPPANEMPAASPTRTERSSDGVAQATRGNGAGRRAADPASNPNATAKAATAGTSGSTDKPGSLEPTAGDPRLTAERRATVGPRGDGDAAAPALGGAQGTLPQASSPRSTDVARGARSDDLQLGAGAGGTRAGPAGRSGRNSGGGEPDARATAGASPNGAKNGNGGAANGGAPNLEPRIGAADERAAGGAGALGSGALAGGAGRAAPSGAGPVGPSRSEGAGRGGRGGDGSLEGPSASALAGTGGGRRATGPGRGGDGVGFGASGATLRPGQGSGSGRGGPGTAAEPGMLADSRSSVGGIGGGRSHGVGAPSGALGSLGGDGRGSGSGGNGAGGSGSGGRPNGDGNGLSAGRSSLAGARRAGGGGTGSGVAASSPLGTAVAGDGARGNGRGAAAPGLGDGSVALSGERGTTSGPRSSGSGGGGSGPGLGVGHIVGSGGSGAGGTGIGAGDGGGTGSSRGAGDGGDGVGGLSRGNGTRRRAGSGALGGGDGPATAAIAQGGGSGAGNGGTGLGTGATGDGTGSGGTGELQPGDLAAQRGGSGIGGTGIGGSGSGTGDGPAPSGFLDGAGAGGSGIGGRPGGEGSGSGSLAASSGARRDGRRAATGGIPDVGPATAPQLAGGDGIGPGEGNGGVGTGRGAGGAGDGAGSGDTRSTAGLAGGSSGSGGTGAGPASSGIVDTARPGDPAGRRDGAGGIDVGIAQAGGGGSGGKRKSSGVAGDGVGAGAASAPTVGAGEGPSGAPGELVAGSSAGEVERREGGPAVFVRADEDGAEGVGELTTPQPGIAERAIRPSAGPIIPQVASPAPRPARRSTVGLARVDGQSRAAIDTYRLRRARRYRDQDIPGAGQPPARTDDTVEAGLAFLARSQSTDGSWSLHEYRGKPSGEKCQYQSNTAGTGLALLSYLGAAYDHYDDKYQDVVRGGLEWLIEHQRDDGDLYQPGDSGSNQVVRFYSHAIATIALCEAYGMTGDERLKKPAQKAVDFIVKTQNRQFGGWRYSPNPESAAYASDTSVSGWMVMALRSAELAKLDVPQKTYDSVEKWLGLAQTNGGDRYAYNPNAADTVQERHGRQASAPMTSIGLLMRMYLGWDRNRPEMVRGANFLLENLPRDVADQKVERLGAYYWYYATQVMFHMRGEHWKQWNERLHPLLIRSQVPDGPLAGSWEPKGPASDFWADYGGRIYVTTFNLLTLEVYYRHLPIYEDTAK